MERKNVAEVNVGDPGKVGDIEVNIELNTKELLNKIKRLQQLLEEAEKVKEEINQFQIKMKTSF